MRTDAMHAADAGLERRATTIDWSAAVWAGVIAGVVFMMAEMLLVWLLQGQSPWGPPRMIAAMVMGQQVLPPPATFDMGAMAAAMAVHFPLAIVYGLMLAPVLRSAGTGMALLVGAAVGLVIYFINFYPIAAVAFPWFAMARGGISILAHVLFGVVLAWSYVALRSRRLHH